MFNTYIWYIFHCDIRSADVQIPTLCVYIDVINVEIKKCLTYIYIYFYIKIFIREK